MTASDIYTLTGIKAGHYTNNRERTGCSVVLCEEGAVVGADVRGSVLGTQELDVVLHGFLVEKIHAIVLTGRSSFGLAAVAGVMRYLDERNKGFLLRRHNVRVPLVAASSIFDLTDFNETTGLDSEAGYEACLCARPEGLLHRGVIGAGTGARVGKLYGRERSTASGVGVATAKAEGFQVTTLAVVNSSGWVFGEGHRVVSGPRSLNGSGIAAFNAGSGGRACDPTTSSSAAVVITDFTLNKAQANVLARQVYRGWKKALRPLSNETDGLVTFTLSTSPVVGSEEHGAVPQERWEELVSTAAASLYKAIVRSALS